VTEPSAPSSGQAFLQALNLLHRLSVAVRGRDRCSERHPPCRGRCARPGGFAAVEARCILGAAARAVGRRGWHIAHSRSGRHRDPPDGAADVLSDVGNGVHRRGNAAMHWLIDLLRKSDARSVECVPNFSEGRDRHDRRVTLGHHRPSPVCGCSKSRSDTAHNARVHLVATRLPWWKADSQPCASRADRTTHPTKPHGAPPRHGAARGRAPFVVTAPYYRTPPRHNHDAP